MKAAAQAKADAEKAKKEWEKQHRTGGGYKLEPVPKKEKKK